MKEERLFEALANIGDDLLIMAQNKRFANPWKRWGKMAACIALVLCLTVAALPYLPMGCGAAEEAPATEEAAEAPAAEEETVMEQTPAEEAPAEESESTEAVSVWFQGRRYELQADMQPQPENLGEELGVVEDSDGRDLIGCRIFAVPDSEDIYVELPEGYAYGQYVE